MKSILNKCDSARVPFEWTINPYRGCEFACKYCYARYTHEYMELDGWRIREENLCEERCGGPADARDRDEIFVRVRERAASRNTSASVRRLILTSRPKRNMG